MLEPDELRLFASRLGVIGAPCMITGDTAAGILVHPVD